MKKLYALLAGVTLASSVSAAKLEKAPRLSMENATVVGHIENMAQKKVADQSKKVLSRADATEAPEITGEYLLCYTNYNKNDKENTTRMSPSNNLVATENEGEYKFETFIFSDVSLKGNLYYDPEFWTDEKGQPVGGEWVFSIPVGPTSEPLFYDDLSNFTGYTNNEPIFFYLAGIDNGQFAYYTNTTFEFVVRDGCLLSPYGEGIGFSMGSNVVNGRLITFTTGYLDMFVALPNAHGTAVETTADENGETVSEEVEFPMYTEAYDIEEEGMIFNCLWIRGFLGWPGEQLFVLNKEEYAAIGIESPLTTIRNIDLYMTQDGETTDVILNVTPELTGASVLTTELIGLVEPSDVSRWLAAYDNVSITLDYNIWTGETGINTPAADNTDAPAVYYNLQGMKVSNPVAGQIYIVKQGNKVSKQIIK